MWKKGHVRRNWTERWFVLKPSTMDYYVSEDLKDKRGEIKLDKSCIIEVGEETWCKHGMFILRCVVCSSAALFTAHTPYNLRILIP